MPTATDLVTDLPADFEVFGQAVATSMADLLGGTTGQVLKKNSNTDMDFVWSADAAGMTNPMTTTGDTIYSSSGSTPARLGIGSTGQVLTVAAGIPSWADASGAANLATIATGSISSGTSFTLSSLSSYDTLTLILNGIAWGATPDSLRVRINNSSSAVYSQNTIDEPESKSFDTQFSSANNQTQIPLTLMNANAGGSIFTILKLTNCKQSGFTTYQHMNQYYQNDTSSRVVTNSGMFLTAAAVSSLVLSTTTGQTFTAGNYQLIGA